MEGIQKESIEGDSATTAALQRVMQMVRMGVLSLAVTVAIPAGDAAAKKHLDKDPKKITAVDCNAAKGPIYGGRMERGRMRHTRFELSEALLNFVENKVSRHRRDSHLETVGQLFLKLFTGDGERALKDVITIWKAIAKNVEIWQESGGVTFDLIFVGVEYDDMKKMIRNDSSKANMKVETGILSRARCNVMWENTATFQKLWQPDKKGAEATSVGLTTGDIGIPGLESYGVGAKFVLHEGVIKKGIPILLKLGIRGEDPAIYEVIVKSGSGGVVMTVGNQLGEKKVHAPGMWNR